MLFQFALVIITRCGFGFRDFAWKEEHTGAEMTLNDALTVVSESVITRLATPEWMYRLPSDAFVVHFHVAIGILSL